MMTQNIQHFLTLLAELEEKLLEYSCELNNEKSIPDMFDSVLDLIDVPKQHNILYLFMKSIDVLVINRPMKKENYIRICQVLTYIITKFQLQNYYSSQDFILIFPTNKLVLFHFLNLNLITIEQLNSHFESLASDDPNIKYLICFFFPELIAFSYDKTEILVTKYHLEKEFLQYMDDSNAFINQRNEYSSDNPILKYIREDNIDSFVDYVSQTKADIDIEVGHTFFDVCKYITPEMSLIDYAMCFGSYNAFKFFFSQRDLKHVLLQSSLVYAVVGGNTAIIRHIENETGYTFCYQDLDVSCLCHRNDLYDYLNDIVKKNTYYQRNEFSFLASSYNFQYLQYYIENHQEKFDELCRNGKIFNYILNIPAIFFYEFALTLPNFDINKINKVFSRIQNSFKNLNGI